MAKNEGKGSGLKATIGFDDSALKEGIGALPNSLQGSLGSLGAIGAQLGIAFGIKEVVGGIYSIGTEFDSAMNTIRTGTGATGPALEALGESFRSVFRGVPDEAGVVASAIADVNTRTGATGATLEGLSTQFLDISRLTGTSVPENIAKTTAAFNQWGVSNDDASDKMDYLWKTAQSTGIGFGDLTSRLTTGGPALRALGLDFDQSAALIGQWDKAGVDAGSMLGGLQIAAKKLSQEGITDVSGSLQGMIGHIRSTSDESQATKLSMELFGRSGVAMKDAIREGRFEIGELVNDLKTSKETISGAAEDTKTLEQRWQIMKNAATEAIAPIGEGLVGSLENWTKVAGRAVDWVGVLEKKFVGENGDGGLAKAAGVLGDVFMRTLSPATAAWAAFDDLGKTLERYVPGVEAATSASKKLAEGQKPVAEGVKTVTPEVQALTEQNKKLEEQIARLLGGTKTKKDADEKAVAVLRTFKEPLDFYISKMNSAATETERAAYKAIFVEENFLAWNSTIDKLSADAQTLTGKLAEQGKGIDDLANFKVPNLVGKLGEMSVKTGDLNSALGGLGVTSASEYSKIAKDAQAAYDVVAGSKLSTDWEKNTALLKALEAQRAAMVVNGQVIPKEMQAQIDALQKTVADPTTGLGKVTQEFKGFGQEVSTVVTNLAQDLGKSLFDGTQSWKEKGIGALKSLGSAVVSQFTQPALNAITGPEGLIIKGLNPLTSQLDGIGTKISSILGTSTSVPTGGVGGGGGGTGGGAGAAIGSGVAGWVGAIGSAVTAVSSIFGNFQMSGMNDKLWKIEDNTRKSMNYLGERSDGGIVMATLATQEYMSYVVDDLRNGPDSIRPLTSSINSNLYWLLKKIEDPGMLVHTMWAVRDNTASIDTTLKGLQGSARVNITNHFTVNGAGSPKDTANEIVDTINRIARLQGATYGV